LIVLGINYHHPDSSACLIKDGQIIAAAEEERFTRIKHFAGFPKHSIDFCLKYSNVNYSEINYVALNFNSNSNIKEKLKYSLLNIHKISTLKKIYNQKNKFKQQNQLSNFFKKKNFKGKIINIDHHLSHLYSSYAISDFTKAIGLTIDGFGDFCSMTSYICEGSKIKVLKKVLFPHSLGIFYQATTQFLGFKNYGDEYKLMGLASYGSPVFVDKFSKIVDFSEKEYFKLNLEYFSHHSDQNFKYFFENGSPIFKDLFSNKFVELFGEPRKKDDNIKEFHKNIACSMQIHFENIIFKILNKLYQEYKIDNLCLSGGCAFNSKLNGLITKKTKFKNVFIQPNAGDGGGAIGASLYLSNKKYKHFNGLNNNKVYLGPKYNNNDIEITLKEFTNLGKFTVKKLSDDEIYKITSKKISKNLIIGWFKGRMEWGPRALGNRSILANPMEKNIKDILNLKIKLRERFRPFAPSVLYEFKDRFFHLDFHSPYMLNVVEAKHIAIKEIPAVVHVDNTCRVQTVKKDENPHFYKLINEFNNITGVPVLVNTSFNENEPIVQNPKEAINCFLRTKMDFLVLENWTISR
tara:strand:- start:365 stop:2095 length:1731 start_codon:yes stop_codon:yes gene_type:complete